MKAILTGFMLMSLMFAVDFAKAQSMQPAQAIAVDASGSTIPTASYLQLDASMDANCTYLSVYNSTAKIIFLATGASSSEAVINYDFPPSASAVHIIHVGLKKGVRLAAKAVTADATTGMFVVNCLQ